MKNLLILAAACLMVTPAMAAMTITFEELGTQPNVFAATAPLTNEYAGMGVLFEGPNSLDGGAILNQGSQFGTSAYSGEQFLAFNSALVNVMTNGGTPQGPEKITFTSGASSVSMQVAQASIVGQFYLTAYDSSDNVVDTYMVETQDWAMMSVSGTNISYVVFDYDNDYGWAIVDDLTYEAVPEPATMALAGAGLLALARKRKKA